ncbi:MAG TPA: PspA/IM30 family protein [Allosphingosinicella sp.]
MSESVFIRVQRVLSASAENAADALERASGTSLMREAIREIDRASDKLRAQLESAESRRLQATHQQGGVREKLEKLAEQARYALGKGRDDLAEAAVSQQLNCEAQLSSLRKIQSDAAAEERELEANLAALKVRKSEMERELASVEAAQRAAASPAGGAKAANGVKHKVERAEAAFERAMEAVGRTGANLADADDAARLAEVDALQRQDRVAERLAALREAMAQAKPSGGKAAKGKKAR